MAEQIRAALTILRRKQVEARTGLSRSTIYLRVSEGTFPKPVSLGVRAVGWIEGKFANGSRTGSRRAARRPHEAPRKRSPRPLQRPPSDNVSPPLPDGTPTSMEVLAKAYREHGPIHPSSYDQARALRRLKPQRDAIRRAMANADAPEGLTDQAATWNAAADDPDGPQVRLLRGDTIKPQPITWLWPGYLAAGKLHIVAGAPGTGKTTLALDFAAAVTSGWRWPDGTCAPVGDVLIWSGEDAPDDTLAPRLRAAGADMARVHFVGDVRQRGEPVPFDPATHFPALALAAAQLPELRLMIVDPIASAVAGDSHHNAEVRRGLQPLVTFAERQGCALIGVTHFTKGTQGREPLERVTGSLAFGAVARIVLGTAKIKDEDGGGRVLVRVKSNIGPDGGGYKYELRQIDLSGDAAGIVASRVEWAGPVDGTAREILANAEQMEPDDAGGENPKEFLRYLLATGPMPATAVFRDAEAHGYSKRQMQRARAAIGARVDKQGMRGGWEWSLTKMPSAPEDAEDASHEKVEPSAPSAVFPGASMEPMPEVVTRTATPAEADELRGLVGAILVDDSEADRAEALATALADPDAALLCYRTLAGKEIHGY